MQDRFKFRAWDKTRKEIRSLWSITPFGVVIGDIKTEEHRISFKDGEIMQCTGLKDKNGKLIFEGDIIANIDLGCVAIVEYYPISYSLMVHIRGMDDFVPIEDICYTDRENDGTPFEIIGNIYENPELLEH